MNAPNSHFTTTHHKTIAIADLFPSPTNPRKRFDVAKLNELAESIKAQGVLQPILARAELKADKSDTLVPTGRYEIIAGERRWRASKIAELTEAPVLVRQLTDQQVLHAQVIENLQRDDLHQLEEAEGYERLLGTKDADGKHYTAETIAAEIGKSRAYVYARLKLLDLCKEVRDALFAGTIGAEVALLVARIPVHSLQVKALKALTMEVGWGNTFNAKGDKMSFRKAKEYMQENFMLDLSRKTFDIADASLLPKAGACTDCPKRTGNAPDLFDDVKSPDIRTDPTCFALKKTAAIKLLQRQAEADGAKFLSGDKAKKLIPHNPKFYGAEGEQLERHGHALLTAKIPGDENGRTWNQAIKQAGLLDPRVANANERKYTIQKIVVQNPHEPGKTHTVINIEEATKALREAGMEIVPKGQASSGRADEETKEEKAERAEEELEAAYRDKLFGETHDKIAEAMRDPAHPVFEKISAAMCAEFLNLIEETGFNEYALERVLSRYAELPNFVEVEFYDWLQQFQSETIPALNATQHYLLMVDLLLMDGLTVQRSWKKDGLAFIEPERLLDLAKTCGIDPKTIKKEAAKEHKAQAAADAKAKAK